MRIRRTWTGCARGPSSATKADLGARKFSEAFVLCATERVPPRRLTGSTSVLRALRCGRIGRGYRSKTPQWDRDPWMLRGLLRCTGCGRVMTTTASSTVTMENADEVPRYYRCRGDAARPACSSPVEVTARHVGARVLTVLREAHISWFRDDRSRGFLEAPSSTRTRCSPRRARPASSRRSDAGCTDNPATTRATMRVSWRLIAAACFGQGRTGEVDAIRAPGACGESVDGDAHDSAEKRRRDVPLAAVDRVLVGVRRPDASPAVCGPVESPFRPLGGVSRGGRGSGAGRLLAPPPSQPLA
jgi:hypothetical protein